MCQFFEVTPGCLNRSLLQLRTILDTYIMQRIESAPEDGCWRNIPQIAEIWNPTRDILASRSREANRLQMRNAVVYTPVSNAPLA